MSDVDGVRKIENVPMDAIGKRAGMCCIQWKDDEFVDIMCRQEHFVRVFSHALCTCDRTHIVAQGVSVRISLHPHAIHDVICLSVRLLALRVCLFLVCLPLLLCLFHSLLVPCPAHHLQCRHRRGLKPLHSRTMRSVASWRYTIFLQVMSPSSSTISTTQRLLQ